jgi:dipeptidyl aminopeptidase/acylaminoacyl peptidase
MPQIYWCRNCSVEDQMAARGFADGCPPRKAVSHRGHEENAVSRRQRIDDLITFAVPVQPALSPDGSQVVYVVASADADADKVVRSLWRVGARTGDPVRLTRGQSDSAPAWSPDGTLLAFLRAQDGPAQVWLLPAGGGEPEQLTTLPLGAGTPVWSPDLYEDLCRELFAELADVEMARPLTPPADPVRDDARQHLGTYERESARLEVLSGGDGPVRRTTVTGPMAELMPEPSKEYPMVALGPDLFLIREPHSRTWTPVTFYQLRTGEKYIHFVGRATPLVS